MIFSWKIASVRGVMALEFSTVASCWKDGLENFNEAALAACFPSSPSEVSARKSIWKELDGNGSGAVSLAEYDSWVNTATGAYETAHGGGKPEGGKSTLWAYARRSLIRAFTLAKGVAPSSARAAAGGAKNKSVDDDYVSKNELRLLLLASRCAMNIFRLFDCADSSNDAKISKDEWIANLDAVNRLLKHLAPAEEDAVAELTADDFDAVDSDHGGTVYLDEAVALSSARIVLCACEL